MTPYEMTLILYNAALLPVLFFSILFILLTLVSIFLDPRRKQRLARAPKLKRYPFITVQVPTFNDPIALRCLEACLNFTYPKHRYEIMIIDDSTKTETVAALQAFAKRHKNVSFFHRKNREGYKPGALRAAHPHVKGELLTLFDADFVPRKDFLQRIAKPFEQENVAIVQGRQGFLNLKENLVTRWAAYLLQVHHYIVMPINNKVNSVFFCGTAGAIRKSAMDSVGGWNQESITEDSDLSVRLLAEGWQNVYLDVETPSEVPNTIEAFVKQQMRWCFGNTRVFFDQWKLILYKRGLTLGQRLMITYFTLGNLVAPVVILMTIAGFMGWFSGELTLFGLNDVAEFFLKFFYTAGFLVMGFVMLFKRRAPGEFGHLLLAAISLGLILAAANSVAVYKAIFQKEKPLFGNKNSWICTPKEGM
jgi:cellulose synthase/poly-beta-1,6-N-acetylglucosamine synthase-like glycosyltransferase